MVNYRSSRVVVRPMRCTAPTDNLPFHPRFTRLASNSSSSTLTIEPFPLHTQAPLLATRQSSPAGDTRFAQASFAKATSAAASISPSFHTARVAYGPSQVKPRSGTISRLGKDFTVYKPNFRTFLYLSFALNLPLSIPVVPLFT